MTRLRAVLTGLTVLALSGSAMADTIGQPVMTLPSSGFSGDASGTIAATGTFQAVWPATNPAQPRKGCLIVNTGTTVEYVYFGTTPTQATAIPLNPASGAGLAGASVSCAAGPGTVLQDALWLTGTTGGSYVAKQQ